LSRNQASGTQEPGVKLPGARSQAPRSQESGSQEPGVRIPGARSQVPRRQESPGVRSSDARSQVPRSQESGAEEPRSVPRARSKEPRSQELTHSAQWPPGVDPCSTEPAVWTHLLPHRDPGVKTTN
jgi:hypothetical protein